MSGDILILHEVNESLVTDCTESALSEAWHYSTHIIYQAQARHSLLKEPVLKKDSTSPKHKTRRAGYCALIPVSMGSSTFLKAQYSTLWPVSALVLSRKYFQITEISQTSLIHSYVLCHLPSISLKYKTWCSDAPHLSRHDIWSTRLARDLIHNQQLWIPFLQLLWPTRKKISLYLQTKKVYSS